MLIWWPYAQVSPIRNPIKALQMMGRFPDNIGMLFEGRNISSLDVPWHYASKYFLITMPEFLLFALAAGIVVAGMAVYRCAKGRARCDHFIEYTLLVICVVLPVAYAAISGASLYDGYRHFLFTLPPLAVLAAAAITGTIQRSRSKLVRAVLLAAIILSLVITAVDYAQLHPYQFVFFNRVFGGGLARAARSYETDYWGSSYKEGVAWLVENYKLPEDGTRPKVGSCGDALSTAYYLPGDRFQYTGYPDADGPVQPDILLATTRWGCDKLLDGKIIHVVERQGAPLLYIKEIGQ
jgi:hypothetical protein